MHKLFRNVPFPTQEGHSFSNTATASYTPGTPNHTVIPVALQIDPTEMVTDPYLTWIRDAVSAVAWSLERTLEVGLWIPMWSLVCPFICGKSVMYANSGVHSFSGVGCVLRASFSARKKKRARHIIASQVSTDLNCVTAENHYQDQTRLPSPFPPVHTYLRACLPMCLRACLPAYVGVGQGSKHIQM